MAETITIARPYAEAAFKLARENDSLGPWSRMLELLDAVVRDEQVTRCIGNPNVTGGQLESLLLGVCGERLDGAGRNFVQLLVQNNRLAVVPEIRGGKIELPEEAELAQLVDWDRVRRFAL